MPKIWKFVPQESPWKLEDSSWVASIPLALFSTYANGREELILRRSLATIKCQFTCQLAKVPDQKAAVKINERKKRKIPMNKEHGTGKHMSFELCQQLCLPFFSSRFFLLFLCLFFLALLTVSCIIYRRDIAGSGWLTSWLWLAFSPFRVTVKTQLLVCSAFRADCAPKAGPREISKKYTTCNN